MENEDGGGKKKKNLYQVAIDDIMAKIYQKEFSFEKPICTEKTLMEKYSVSRITAKRAITELEHQGILYRKRGHGSFVSRDVFSGNVQKASKSARIFALILPFSIASGGIFATVQEINNILNTSGHYMCIYIAENVTKERTVLKKLMEDEVSGLVFYPLTNDYQLELLNVFVMKRVPVVIIDKSNDCSYVHGVVSDNYAGGTLLTEHLISLGHRRIVYLSRFSTSELSTVRDRFGGYIHAMRKANLVPNAESVVKQIADSAQSMPEWNRQLRNTIQTLYENGVTAIETENDEAAFLVISACKDLGISVPEQMSVCGFDNSEWSQKSVPNITTAAQNFSAIGRKTANILLKSITEEEIQIEKAVVPVQLVIRESTGAPAKR